MLKRIHCFYSRTFGDMNNLGIIAKAFDQQYALLRITYNHGRSFHHDEMDYPLMADDLLRSANIWSEKSHSYRVFYGRQTAMQFALTYPDYVKVSLCLILRPSYENITNIAIVFQALFAVAEAQSETRQQAKVIMEQFIRKLQPFYSSS